VRERDEQIKIRSHGAEAEELDRRIASAEGRRDEAVAEAEDLKKEIESISEERRVALLDAQSMSSRLESARKAHASVRDTRSRPEAVLRDLPQDRRALPVCSMRRAALCKGEAA